MAACSRGGEPSPQSRPPGFDREAWTTTFHKYLPQAASGDPEYQNLIGFMLFFGEGISMNRLAAYYWFDKAAAQGYRAAQKNLAIMHYLGEGVERDAEKAARYARLAGIADLEALVKASWMQSGKGGRQSVGRRSLAPRFDVTGRKIYVTFCAGCHGLNGIAAFIGSPSFAMGERLDKPDDVLLDSIKHGKGVMPSWGDKLPADYLVRVLRFVRDLERRYQQGIAQALIASPEMFYLFGPMERDASAYCPLRDEGIGR